jgi:glycosyltransferase involved in cell wall biosynthesis
MRIALVSSRVAPERAGGSEAYAADLATSLTQSHEVLLFTGGRAPLENVPTQRLPALPDLASDASAPHKAVWHLRDQWLPRTHHALARGLRDFAPDVVHTHHPQGLSGAVFTAVRATEVRHVHTVHDANAFCARISMAVNGEFCGGDCVRCLVQRQVRPRLLARGLDLLLAPSRYFRDLYVSRGVIEAARTEVIAQGAPSGTTRSRAPGEALVVGFIGALSPHKGIGTLLAAFASAPPSWRLRVAGSGPLAERVKAAAGSDSRIEHVGFVSADDKDGFLDSLDLLVIPSEYEENAPLVAVEAAVRGLPAVVSDRGGLPETPEARVFRAQDPHHLLEVLREFHRGGLQDASRRLLESHDRFLWSTHVERVEAALEGAARG